MSPATPPSSPEQIHINLTPDAPRQFRHLRLILWTLPGLVLIGLLAGAAWWWFFHSTVYFVSLPAVDYGVLVVPPLRFAAEDIEALAALPRPGQPPMPANLRTSQSIATLAARLQVLGLKEKDTLILYLRVYGASDDGKAWLLWSDYLQNAASGRCSLTELLGQVAKCRAGKKLLLLDAGDLACDPRLGVFVNEFPLLLDEEVRGVNDPGLWVLASNRPLEMSHVSESERRSAFGYFVGEGLAGAADRDGDGMIDLAELVGFVRGGVASWVSRQTRGVETQTPWLLRGGEGAVRAPAGLALMPVSGRSADGDRSHLRRNGAATALQAARQVVVLLQEGWRLRDRAQQRSPAAPWTPVDYAPHLWRAYQELLLGYERRYCSGAQYDPEQLAADLRTNILPLANLLDGGPLPPAAGKATVIGRLADARQRFLAAAGGQQLDRLGKDKRSGRYLELVRLKNDLVFRARDYVRWQMAAGRSSAGRHRLYQPIYDFLIALRQFVDQLEAIEGAAPALAKADQVDQTLGGLDLLVQTLRPLPKAIEEDGLYRDAAELIELADKKPTSDAIAGPLDALLATPLLPAALRMRLLQARSRLEQPFAAEEQSAEDTLRPPSLVSWSGRLYDQAALEEQLVGVAEPTAQFPPLQSTDAVTMRTLLAQYQWLGKALGQFYQQLPTLINQNFQASGPAVVRRCERWLRAVDARDAEQVRAGVAAIAVRGVPFPPPAVSPASAPSAAGKTSAASKTPKAK